MVYNQLKNEQINVLASAADWAWDSAKRNVFAPCGVNLLVADSADEFVSIIERKHIHTAIVDMDAEKNNGLATIKLIRIDYPLLPCILLKRSDADDLLDKALQLDVFSVIDKPVDMSVLREQLDRLFMKKYGSGVFAA